MFNEHCSCVFDIVNRTIWVELMYKIQFLFLEDANFAKGSQEVLEGSGIASNWFYSLTML